MLRTTDALVQYMLVISAINMHHSCVEMQQLRYVVALAEESSFTRAAARCYVAQSALSHSIKNLETEIGVALFHRTSRRVELTPAGIAFLASARKSLRFAERAVTDAAEAEGNVRGRLSVGAIPTVTAVDVLSTLKVFRELHPDVSINFQISGSDEIESAIIRGDVDVGFLGLPENRSPRGVDSQLLSSDRLVAVVSNEHPLAKQGEIQLVDLAEETFADFPAGTPAREESDLAFATAGIYRHVAFESMAVNLSLDLVIHNLAITLLPALFVPDTLTLTSLPITDGPSRVEYIAWSNFSPSPAAKAFLELTNARQRETPSE